MCKAPKAPNYKKTHQKGIQETQSEHQEENGLDGQPAVFLHAGSGTEPPEAAKKS